MRKEIKYSLGLDIGVASIGWGIINLDQENNLTHIVDTGVVVVENMEDKNGNLANGSRRDDRGARRTVRRRQNRIKRIKKLCSEELKISNLDNIYLSNNQSVYKLKVNGLNQKLTVEQLSIVLIHYAKHRGFKSNRKDEVTKEDGIVLEAIAKNNQRRGKRFISELILDELDGINKVKNSEEYRYSFTRDQFQEEIKYLLDIQIKHKLITEEFKKAYLEIWSSQRDFSEGPGQIQEGQNEYAVNYGSVFGFCTFEPKELRAPKKCITQQVNTGLTRLINLSYKVEGDSTWKQLTKEQIQQIIAKSYDIKEIKYKHVASLIDKNAIIKFKDLRSSKDDFIKVLNEYKKKHNLEQVVINDDQEFQKVLNKKQNDKELFSMSTNASLKTVFRNQVGQEAYDNLPIEYKDDIVKGLTFYKTDDRIYNYFKGIETERKQNVSELDWELYPSIIEDVIPKLKAKEFSESAGLSLKLLYKINPLMIQGIKYSDALDQLGYDHSKAQRKEITKTLKLGKLKDLLETHYKNEISNPRVVRVLTRLGSLIDSCVDTYGSPYFINIEVARDINLKSGKRAIMQNEQLNNLTTNERIKGEILVDHPNVDYSRITKNDIEKYKLYHEQNGMCMYSLSPIAKGDILTSSYEVDHIVPYSLSTNNSMNNKTLVKKVENQNKKDMVPLEYFNKFKKSQIEKYKLLVENNHNMNNKKKEYYLVKSAGDIIPEMKDGYIEATRFITKYLIDILSHKLIFKGEGNQDKERIISHKAGYVHYFKQAIGVSNLTHSLENEHYKRKNILKIINISSDINKSNNLSTIKLGVENEVNQNKTNPTYEISLSQSKETEKTPEYIKTQNNDIEQFIEQLHQIDLNDLIGSYFTKNKYNINQYDVFDQIKTNEQYTNKQKDNLNKIFTLLKAQITKEVIKKNRDNHLHHALDAIATASLTKSTQMKISAYEKTKYNILQAIKKGPRSLTYGNQQAIITTPDDFKQIEHQYIKELFPKPFENIKEEIQAFVYERDIDVQKEILGTDKFRNIRPLIPVQNKKRRYEINDQKIRVQTLHKETIYGEKKYISEDGIEEGYLVKRISTKDLNKKNIEKIYDKENSAKHTYQACLNWLENKDQADYPMLSSGRYIKKVKIIEGSSDKALQINRGFAGVDLTVRIDVFKKENDDKFYFLQQNSLSLIKDNQGDQFNQILWYGQGDKNIRITNKQIKEQFTLVCQLHPGDLIDLTLTKERQGLVYVVGFTNGTLEVKSLIGDNYDTRNNNFPLDKDNRCKITISTILRIQKQKINIRGELKQ